jgi:hypothetical protein
MVDHFSILRQALQQKTKPRTKSANFRPMGSGQFLENLCSGAAELYIDLAPVLHAGLPFNQTLGSEAIHQADGTVVSDLKLFCQFADCNPFSFGEPFNGEQGLVLARC